MLNLRYHSDPNLIDQLIGMLIVLRVRMLLVATLLVRIHKKIKKFGIHEYQKIWYSKS